MGQRAKRRSDEYLDENGEDVRVLKQGPPAPLPRESEPLPHHVECARVRGEAEHAKRQELLDGIDVRDMPRSWHREVADKVRAAGDAAVAAWREARRGAD